MSGSGGSPAAGCRSGFSAGLATAACQTAHKSGLEVGRGDPEVAAGVDGIDIAQDAGAGVDDELAQIDEHAAVLEQGFILDPLLQGQNAVLVVTGEIVVTLAAQTRLGCFRLGN